MVEDSDTNVTALYLSILILAPIPSYLHASVPSMPRYPSRRKPKTPRSAPPQKPVPPEVQVR